MDWKKALGRIAPTLASAIPIGGPIGAAAIRVLADLFGTEPTETAIEAKVATLTGAELVTLKQADQQFAKDMRALEVDVFRVDAADRADARAMQRDTKSRIAPVLATAACAILVAMIGVLAWVRIPPENRDIFGLLLGNVSAITGMVFSFYFGSSHGSQAKDATVAKLAGESAPKT